MVLKNIYTWLLVVVIALSSCSKYDKLLKSSNNELKYEKALEYYKKKDYYRTLQLLDDLIAVYRGTDKAEKVYYYYAYSYYGQGDYLLASYHFSNYAKNFPNSQSAEECEYMAAYCYYLDSPDFSLDATSTTKAISELQLFINNYPNSSRVNECNKLIDDLRAKLEMKSFENAKLYFNMDEFKAAIVALNNTLKDFPDTKKREEILYLVACSNYELAKNSVEKKKDQRLKEALDACTAFIDRFPDSKNKNTVENYKENINKEITKRNINK